MLVGRRQLLRSPSAATASAAAPSSRTSRIAFAAGELVAVVVAVARALRREGRRRLRLRRLELLGRRRERRGLLGLGRPAALFQA